jgi:sodium-dependent dicarboxylate transporter 2/3/5
MLSAEERFERVRRRTGLALAPAIFLLFLLLPFEGLSREAHGLAAVVGFVATLWITEAIPIPAAALLGPTLCVLMGIGPAKTVFAPFADPVVFLFIGSFVLAQAMFVHGLDRRIAVSILALKWVGARPWRIMVAFAGVTAFISMWVSNTATTAMMYPIALSLLTALDKASGRDKRSSGVRPYAVVMLLLCAYASSLGGLGTPVGSPPNLIGIGMIDKATGVHISFFQWMLLTLPIMGVMFLILLPYLGRAAKGSFPDTAGLQQWVRAERDGPGPLSRGERNTAMAFALTAAMWIVPGLLTIILGNQHPVAKFLTDNLPESAAAIIGATLLFLFPVKWREHEFTLSWKQAVDIDWGTILLFGGGLALGGLMFSTGLGEAAGRAIEAATGAHSLAAVTFLVTGLGIIMSEFSSNTASANVIIPIAIGLAESSGVNPLIPALGACIGTSMGFLLPVSTPPNAIVYGSGLVPITKMIRYGLFLDLTAAVVVPSVLLLWGPVVLK